MTSLCIFFLYILLLLQDYLISHSSSKTDKLCIFTFPWMHIKYVWNVWRGMLIINHQWYGKEKEVWTPINHNNNWLHLFPEKYGACYNPSVLTFIKVNGHGTTLRQRENLIPICEPRVKCFANNQTLVLNFPIFKFCTPHLLRYYSIKSKIEKCNLWIIAFLFQMIDLCI